MIWNKKWLLIAIVAAIFVAFSPELDQYIAALSYTETTRMFYGEQALWCKVIYYSVPVITVALVLTPLVWLFISRHDSQKCKIIVKFGLMTYLALSLGPGLVVNVMFKDHWGRPRPYQVLRDGKKYSPFWQPHFSEKKDNSFPGGHASIGFFLGIPFLALGRKKAAITFSLIGGMIVGTVRILQGGHYLSDVLFAGIFVWVVAKVVVYGMPKWLWKDSVSE